MKQSCRHMDRIYMYKAIQLAKEGLGQVHPNPLVGAVLVKKGRIIGEGSHRYFGGPHAEVNAIEHACKDVQGSTLYVTLEPCAHYGKTGPCADFIVKHKIKEVVIASRDPNPAVTGKGIAILRKNHIKTRIGVCQKEAQELNRAYFHWIKSKKPYGILKIAQTLDGKIAGPDGQSKWISGKTSREFSQRLRLESDAIVVGINTVLKDNPRLSVRCAEKKRPILKIILDSRLQTPPKAKLFSSSDKEPVLIATTRRANRASIPLLRNHAEILFLSGKNGRVNIKKLMEILGSRGVTQVLFEGGGGVAGSVIAEKLVQEIYFILAPKIMGTAQAVNAVWGNAVSSLKDIVPLKIVRMEKMGADYLVRAVLQ